MILPDKVDSETVSLDKPRELAAQLYGLHGKALFRYLVSLCGNHDEANDLLQLIFVKICRRPERFQNLKDSQNFLLKVARNEWLDEIRRKKKQGGSIDPTELLLKSSSESSPSGAMEKTEWLAQLQRELFSLPAEQRELIQLHLFENLSFQIISEITNTARSTLSMRYQRAMKRLKEKLND